MGSNKILTFGESATNIQNDAEYQASSERVSGNTLNSIANSALINKVLKQTAAVANAIGQIVAQSNNFDAEDNSPSNLATGLINAFQNIHKASNVITSASATWTLTFAETIDMTQSQVFLFATKASSSANQKIKIGSTTYSFRFIDGQQIGANGIQASTAAPIPVLAAYPGAGSNIYFFSSLSASLLSDLTAHLTDHSNPHQVTYTQVGAARQSGWTASRVLISNSNGDVSVSGTTTTKLGYLNNVDSDIQSQLDGKQGNLTFDDTPASGSSNPVKSSGIYNALAGKQNALTFDDSPTRNSDNPVKSGGIFTSQNPPVTSVTASRPLTLNDVGAFLSCYTNNVTITIPTNASVAIPVGAEILVYRNSDNSVTFTAASGVTLRSVDNEKTITAKYGVACLKKIGTDVWLLFGHIE